MGRLFKWIFRSIEKIILTFVIIIISIQFLRGYFFVNNDLELMPWHSANGKAELEYSKFDNIQSYLSAEKSFLAEKYKEVEIKEGGVFRRYISTSPSSPLDKDGNDINQSFEMIPENIKGGVLLLHGLTDSPYTMRDLAKIYYEKGYYVLCLRYMYHGTYPGEMLKLNWEDFSKTAKFGAKMVAEKIKGVPGAKFYMGGYSTGAAATLQYISYDMKNDKTLPKPEKLFWFSPAMGVTKFAKFGVLDLWVTKIPYFKKFAWLDIYPEYDGAKYNSFPKNAGMQVYYLIDNARKNLNKLSEEEKSNLPTVYAYTSVEDATVEANDLFTVFGQLKDKGGELVIFDANRKFNDFYKPDIQKLKFVDALKGSNIKGQITILTNYENRDDNVSLFKYNKGSVVKESLKTPLKWSPFTISLAHVSIPISPKNSLYGKGTILGDINLKGENGLILVSPGMLLRLRYNEFFDYMEENLKEKL